MNVLFGICLMHGLQLPTYRAGKNASSYIFGYVTALLEFSILKDNGGCAPSHLRLQPFSYLCLHNVKLIPSLISLPLTHIFLNSSVVHSHDLYSKCGAVGPVVYGWLCKHYCTC